MKEGLWGNESLHVYWRIVHRRLFWITTTDLTFPDYIHQFFEKYIFATYIFIFPPCLQGSVSECHSSSFSKDIHGTIPIT